MRRAAPQDLPKVSWKFLEIATWPVVEDLPSLPKASLNCQQVRKGPAKEDLLEASTRGRVVKV